MTFLKFILCGFWHTWLCDKFYATAVAIIRGHNFIAALVELRMRANHSRPKDISMKKLCRKKVLDS